MDLRYKEQLQITRLKCGVLHVQAEDERDLYFGQGYAQAMDRGMQMILTRILGQGRATEYLLDNDSMLQIDIFFRRMNWYQNSQEQIGKISALNREKLQALCDGINRRFSESIPWEMKLLHVRPEPWKPEDCLLFMKLIGYVSLQQSQSEMERLIVQMVQAGVPREYLEELFSGNLQGMDEELLKKVILLDKIVPDYVTWKPWLSAFISSNNWAVTGAKSASGKPMYASDPHLEANRLPNVWQEFVLKCKDRYCMGAGIPGIPGILIGRNNDVSWGATYTFMDSLDSWCEQCQDGKYFKDGQWHEFQQRREVLKRKKHGMHTATFYENEHGVLDGDPYRRGHYLSTLWASGRNTGSSSIESIFKVLHAKSTEEMMDIMGQVEVSFNWVMADRHGNIGYQMSGVLPIRRQGISGLIPLDGTKSENDWQGYYDYHDISRSYNPECGYIITANNDLNYLGKVASINLPLGDYRARRIADALQTKEKISVQDFIELQYDTFSYQAKIFMDILRPMLDDSPGGMVLKEWDCRYDSQSIGAWVFERFYIGLIKDVFGQISSSQGEITPVEHLLQECSTFITFYANFDQVLLKEKSIWFNGRDRTKVFADVYAKEIVPLQKGDIKKWGEVQKVILSHILFDRKMPGFLGFDYGPISLPGGRATPQQGQVYRNAGRTTSFAPSLRVIVDMAQEGVLSQILGGPSDRRFSKWYTSEVEMWQNKRYKDLRP